MPTPAAAQPDWGSLQDAADLLDCSTRTIRNYVARGDLAAYRVGPRMLRLDLNDVRGLLKPIPAGSAA
jgi:excisionase family DNA binding protein